MSSEYSGDLCLKSGSIASLMGQCILREVLHAVSDYDEWSKLTGQSTEMELCAWRFYGHRISYTRDLNRKYWPPSSWCLGHFSLPRKAGFLFLFNVQALHILRQGSRCCYCRSSNSSQEGSVTNMKNSPHAIPLQEISLFSFQSLDISK